MIFPTCQKEKRPVRLSEGTRCFAWEAMHGKYGDEAKGYGSVSLDDIEGFEELSPIEKYDAAIEKIARTAPLRLTAGELICGAATLGDAICHKVPAKYKGEFIMDSVSHITIRYDKVIREGLSSYREDIALRLSDASLTEEKRRFLKSLDHVIDCIAIWHKRYLDLTKDSRPDIYETLLRVPFHPARSFREALQSLWFIFAFVRLMGNWPGIGRMDLLLGDYLEKDLSCKKLTIEEARELCASFFIKGCEWIESETPPASGDAQHYQNIVLAGLDENENEVTNTLTYLILEVVEELGISDYPITVRLNKNSDRALKEKIASVMRHGGGIVAVYNEDLILESFANEGYSRKEALSFANDGCWEVQVPGKTDFGYTPFDSLACLERAMGLYAANDDGIFDYSSIDEVYSAFLSEVSGEVASIYEGLVENSVFENGEWRVKTPPVPNSAVSLFEDGCIEKALPYYGYGARYTVRSPHIGGTPDVANSLLALDRIVFSEKKISYREFIKCLRNNWEGHEQLRLYAKNRITYYGNDSDEADSIHSKLLSDFADIVKGFDESGRCPVKFIPGVSTFGRQIGWAKWRSATAFGAKKGDILSGNASPTPGTDLSGATSIIRSYCKADLVRQSCGAALDIKLFPDSVSSENGICALVALIDGFLALSGFFMQLDCVDLETLLCARKDPQKYKTLSVRVSGWNARFVTLSPEWQDMIIERTAQNI